MSDKDPVAMVADIQATIAQMKENDGKIMAELKASLEQGSKDAKIAAEKAEKNAQEQIKLSAQLCELQQKMNDGVISGKVAPKTLGQMVIQSDAFAQFVSGSSNKLKVEANTITGQEGAPAENSDTLVAPQRLNGIIPGAFRSLRIRDVLPQGTTTSNAVEYTRELAFTNAAAETSEGVTKPEATLTFELATANVRTIAHFIKVSKQVLDDAPALQSYIDTRLRYGVELRYDNQLLNGNGANPNISGMTASGNFTAFTPLTGANQLDNINSAIEQVALADYAATAIILNPADWYAIERLKVGSSDDRYIVGDPTAVMGPRLWGLPVVVSNNMTAGKVLVGAMDIAYQVWNRQGVTVEMFEQDDVNVQKNLLTVRAEARGTLATYRPASVVYGDLVLA